MTRRCRRDAAALDRVRGEARSWTTSRCGAPSLQSASSILTGGSSANDPADPWIGAEPRANGSQAADLLLPIVFFSTCRPLWRARDSRPRAPVAVVDLAHSELASACRRAEKETALRVRRESTTTEPVRWIGRSGVVVSNETTPVAVVLGRLGGSVRHPWIADGGPKVQPCRVRIRSPREVLGLLQSDVTAAPDLLMKED